VTFDQALRYPAHGLHAVGVRRRARQWRASSADSPMRSPSRIRPETVRFRILLHRKARPAHVRAFGGARQWRCTEATARLRLAGRCGFAHPALASQLRPETSCLVRSARLAVTSVTAKAPFLTHT